MLPFTAEQFFDVFGSYNRDLPWAWLILSSVGLAGIGSALTASRTGTKATLLILAVLWGWAGLVYHIGYFSEINTVAVAFGICFCIESLFLIIWVFRSNLPLMSIPNDIFGIGGVLFVTFALFFYPIINNLVGHSFPRTPTFGLPCPLVIFTTGVLFWSKKPVPIMIMAIPAFWSIIGSTAAFLFGVWPDLSLVVALIAIVYHRFAVR
jgi:hypothetical protein